VVNEVDAGGLQRRRPAARGPGARGSLGDRRGGLGPRSGDRDFGGAAAAITSELGHLELGQRRRVAGIDLVERSAIAAAAGPIGRRRATGRERP